MTSRRRPAIRRGVRAVAAVVVVLSTVALGSAAAVPAARAGTSESPPTGPTHPTPTVLATARASGRVVALTFDDGPTARYTPQVLAVLAREHVTATFCQIGRQAYAQPALVRRVVAAGHRLCDHTITHDSTIGRHSPTVIDQQLRTSRDVLSAAAGGAGVDYFRAPDGNWTPTLVRLSAQDGMQPLGWSVDTRDWTRPGTAAIVRTVEAHVRPGAVILFHDGGGPRDQTVQAIGQLIPWLRAQGYSFVLP